MTQTKKPQDSKPATEQKPRSERDREKEQRAELAEQAAVDARESSAALLASDPWGRASHVATVGLFIIALVWCAYVAQPVIVPVLLAWVIATIVLPLVRWMQDRKVPRVVGVILVTFALMALIISIFALLSTPVAYWLGRASELGVLIKQKLQTINQPLALLDEATGAIQFEAIWPSVTELAASDLDGDGRDELLVASGRSITAVGAAGR